VVPDAHTKVTTVGTDGIRVQTDQMTDKQTLAVRNALADRFNVDVKEVTTSFIGPSWGADVTRQSLFGLAIFLALTFIILALYRWTFRFTDGWLLLMVNLMVTQTLMMAFLAFLYQLIELAINTANNTATESKLSYVAPFVIVCLLGIVVFRFIPSFASAIVGGMPLGQGDTPALGGWRSTLWATRQVTGRARIMSVGLAKRRTASDVKAARARAIQRETERNGQL